MFPQVTSQRESGRKPMGKSIEIHGGCGGCRGAGLGCTGKARLLAERGHPEEVGGCDGLGVGGQVELR